MFVFSKCLKAIEIFENIICSAGLLAITFLTSALVLNRYWLHYEVMWLGDFTHYLFVFTALCAIAFTTREDGHTSVDILSQVLLAGRPKAQGIYKIGIHLLTLVTLCVFHNPMLHFAKRAIKHPSYGTMVPWFNTSWLIITCYVMLLLCILHTVVSLTKRMFILKRCQWKLEKEGM
jgi:C4-dicarboxylate transporter DctQ subunit